MRGKEKLFVDIAMLNQLSYHVYQTWVWMPISTEQCACRKTVNEEK